MTQLTFAEEAEACRRRAHAYVGRPEMTFLLRVAKEFDRLEAERGSLGKAHAT